MKKALAIGIPIVVIGALVGWRYVAKTASDAALKQAQQGRQRAAASVVLTTAGLKVIAQKLDTVGSVEAPYNVKLAAQVGGVIQFLQVREGDPVRAGQVLVKIDPTEVEGEVLQQQAAVAEARQKLAQAQITENPTNVNVQAQIVQQQAAVASALADLNQVAENYNAQVASAKGSVTDAEAKVASAKAAVESAEATVESAKANEAAAQSKYDRTNNLYKQGFVAAQDLDDALAAWKVQQGAVKVAQKQQSSAESALKSAQAVLGSAVAQEKITERKGKSDIADARAKWNQAKATLSVAQANRAQTPAYQQSLAALQSEVSAAEAQLRQAEARRGYTIIKAPIDGTVTARLMDPGATASSGSQILTIESLTWVYVTTSVPIEDSTTVVQGMPVAITFDALPGKALQGSVGEINKSADPQSRQFTVRVRLQNPGNVLRPGMFGHLLFTLASVNAQVAVPREAVQQKSDGPHVMTVEPDSSTPGQYIAHDVKVTLGASDAASYEIKDGLKPGDKVISLSYQPVRDKGKVREDTGGQGQGKRGGKNRGQPQ